MSFIIIIPARFYSKRLPAKPLLDIKGKPMIAYVIECAYKTGAERVIVATDHPDIAMAANTSGGEVCMTRTDHRCGTERLAEVIDKYQFKDSTVIVNIQGDEPLIPSDVVKKMVQSLFSFNANMATVASFITNPEEVSDPNVVKVVTDMQSYALYFSRSNIPWKYNKSIQMNTCEVPSNYALKHIGIYAYNAKFIRRYVSWKPCPLEQIEKLEQLRVLWYGEKIYVYVAKSIFNISVDTPEDLERVRAIIRN